MLLQLLLLSSTTATAGLRMSRWTTLYYIWLCRGTATAQNSIDKCCNYLYSVLWFASDLSKSQALYKILWFLHQLYFSISATVLHVYSTTSHNRETRGGYISLFRQQYYRSTVLLCTTETQEEGILFYIVPKHSYCALSRGGTSTRLHLRLRLPCTIELTCFLLMWCLHVHYWFTRRS